MDKGKEFENLSYELIKKSLEENRLGLIPSNCRLFKNKGYFSRDRGKNIIFDLSIELHLPNSSTWSLLWVWECKNYTRNIPVDDVEEFWSKLNQIGGVNIKGGLIISSALQASAFNFAKSKGMAVVRILPEENVRTILWNRNDSNQATSEEEIKKQRYSFVKNALINNEHFGNQHDFLGINGVQAPISWKELIIDELEKTKNLDQIAGAFLMETLDTFNIDGKSILFGPIKSGQMKVGDKVTLFSKTKECEVTILDIDIYRRRVEFANAGTQAGIVLDEIPSILEGEKVFIAANEKAYTSLINIESIRKNHFKN